MIIGHCQPTINYCCPSNEQKRGGTCHRPCPFFTGSKKGRGAKTENRECIDMLWSIYAHDLTRIIGISTKWHVFHRCLKK